MSCTLNTAEFYLSVLPQNIEDELENSAPKLVPSRCIFRYLKETEHIWLCKAPCARFQHKHWAAWFFHWSVNCTVCGATGVLSRHPSPNVSSLQSGLLDSKLCTRPPEPHEDSSDSPGHVRPALVLPLPLWRTPPPHTPLPSIDLSPLSFLSLCSFPSPLLPHFWGEKWICKQYRSISLWDLVQKIFSVFSLLYALEFPQGFIEEAKRMVIEQKIGRLTLTIFICFYLFVIKVFKLQTHGEWRLV